MTPTIFCETVTEKLAPLGVKCKTLGKEFILTEKMGAFWSVAKGSIEEPKMLKLEYNGPTKAGNKKICLVGKGVTFDAGGISIKVNSYECLNILLCEIHDIICNSRSDIFLSTCCP